MSAGALVLGTNNAVEFSHTEAVHSIGLNGAVAATLQTDVCLATILVHLACNDVQYASHGIAAVQQAGRTAKHLNLLCHHGLVSVWNGMSHKTGILWLSVDKYQQLGTASYTTNLQTSCCTCTDTVA